MRLSHQSKSRRLCGLTASFCFLMLAITVLFSPPARAQSTDDPKTLATWSSGSKCDPQNDSTLGCCGGPGRPACGIIYKYNGDSDGCLKPFNNVLRWDGYQTQRVCNIPPPGDVTQPPVVSTGPQTTFYFTSDLHFYRTTFDLNTQVNFPQALNLFGLLPHYWPAGSGIPSTDVVGAPAAMVIGGDITTGGTLDGLAQFRWFWEKGNLAAGFLFPIMPGLGNHDIYDGSATGKYGGALTASDAQRMWDYLAKYVTGVNMDKSSTGAYGVDDGGGTHNYSWDWSGVHFIQLNTWAGEQLNHYYPTSNGLAWLRNDLATNVGTSNRPVILFQHYELGQNNYGFSLDVEAQFKSVIAPYHVVALFDGHTHTAKLNNDAGFDEFTNGSGGQCFDGKCYFNLGEATFLAARVSGNGTYLDVAPYHYTRIDSTSEVTPDTTSGRWGLAHGASGCRVRIDSVPDLVPGFFSINAPGSLPVGTTNVTVTNTSGAPLSGPLALVITSSANILSPYFSTSCKDSPYYLLLDLPGGVMQPNQTVTVPISVSAGASASYSVAQMIPWGSHPAHTVNVSSNQIKLKPANLALDTTVTVAAASATSFTTSISYTGGGVSNWLSAVNPTPLNSNGTGSFALHLQNVDQNSGVLTADVTVTANSGASTVIKVEYDSIPNPIVTPSLATFASGNVQNVTIADPNGNHVKINLATTSYTGFTAALVGPNANTDGVSGETPITLRLTATTPVSRNHSGLSQVNLLWDATLYNVTAAQKLQVPVNLIVGTLNFFTVPTGSTVLLDSVPYSVAQNIELIAGQPHTVAAPDISNQTQGLLRWQSWSDGGAATHTISLPDGSHMALTANFQQFYNLQTVLDSTSKGSGSWTLNPLSPNNDGYYASGTTVQVQAVPSTGSSFGAFSGDISGTTNPASLTLTHGSSVKLRFDNNPAGTTILDTLPSGQPILIDGNPFVTPQTVYWPATESHVVTVNPIGTTPGTQLALASWSDGNLNATRTIAGIASGTRTLVATLKTQFQISALALPSDGGTVSGAGWYDGGTILLITATPASGFQFDRFTSPAAKGNPLTFTVSQPAQVQASFSSILNPTLVASPGQRGYDSNQPNLVALPITLQNTGAGTAGDAIITGITGFKVIAGSGAVGVDPTTPLPVPVGSLRTGQSSAATVLLSWPATATRVQMVVQFSANNGSYTGSTTLNLFR